MVRHGVSWRELLAWIAFCLCLVLVSRSAQAQWSNVTSGVDHRQFTVSGPNNVFVMRMDQQEPSVTIESSIAQGRLSGGRETVSEMVSRYDDAIGYWGQAWGGRHEVVAAINGSFFDLNTGVPEPGQVQSGWYAWRYGQFGGRSGFAWTVNRTAFIGACIHHRAGTNFVTFADQSTQEISEINKKPGNGELTLFTHHHDTHTPSQSAGVEVLVQMDRPTMILPDPAKAEGTVVAVRSGQGQSPLYFDHIVLSAAGGAASTLQSSVAVGDRIGISQEFASYELDCNTPNGLDWSKTYAGVGGNFQFLKGGTVQSTTDPGLTARHPRTAVALDASYVYFIVVDGRTSVSVGMTMTELGNFCRSELGATDGVNHDGGGSSAIWVDGQIRNAPSDGSERTVANGLMMVRVHPTELSNDYFGGDTVATTGSTPVRLGPGTHFGEVSTVPAGSEGTLIHHSVAGVRAKGTYWWLVEFDGVHGWVDEGSLELVARDPDAGVQPKPDASVPPDGSVPPDAGAESSPDADTDAVVTADSDIGSDATGSWAGSDSEGDGCSCRLSSPVPAEWSWGALVFAGLCCGRRRNRLLWGSRSRAGCAVT